MRKAPRSRRYAASARRAGAVAAVALGGWGTVACGTQSAPAAVPVVATVPAPVATAPPTVTAAAAPPRTVPARRARSRSRVPGPSVARYVAVAKQVYDTETSGIPIRRELRHVAQDPTVLRLVRSGSPAALRRYVTSRFTAQWFANEHMSRLRILRPGSRTLDLGVTWVVWPMLQKTVRTAGRPPTTIQVAVQDVIGFVRSMHNKHPAVQIVVRDASGRRAVSLLPRALHAALPATGTVTLAGTRYEVRSFRRRSFAQHALAVTVWVLLPAA